MSFYLMPLFSILWSAIVFWNIWKLDLTTCNFTSLLVNYHTFFLVRFSFVFLSIHPADMSRPFQSYDFNVLPHLQGVSRLVDITAGGDFLGLCDKKSSYKHVSDFGWLQSYDRLKLRIEGNDY